MNHEQAVSALSALAQETRLKLFQDLMGAGQDGLPPAVLAARFDLNAATLSFHLRHLERAGLVRSWRDGRQVLYAADLVGTRRLLTFLTETCCQGHPDVCGLTAAPLAECAAEAKAQEKAMSSRPERTYNVLFLCTGNSARSIMAECALHRYGIGKFNAYSAGSQPRGSLHPMTIKLLRNLNYKVDDLRSKSWEEFARPDSPQLDFVFTVCDQAAAEACPAWPGQPMTAHWGIEDPALATGAEDDVYRTFKRIYFELENRCKIFANLRIEGLDKLSLSRRLETIGQEHAQPTDA